MSKPIRDGSGPQSFLKYINYSIDLFEKHDPIPFIEKSSGDPILLNPTKSKKANIVTKLKNLKTKDGKLLPSLAANKSNYQKALDEIVISVDEKINWIVTSAKISKPTDKIPLGYLSEILLQAAIVARFVAGRKGDRVTIQHLLHYLNEFIKNPTNKDVESVVNISVKNSAKNTSSAPVTKAFRYMVPNSNTKVGMDTVYVFYVLNAPAFSWLKAAAKNSASTRELTPYFNDALNYVNSGGCKEHAMYFYTNGRKDRIDIVSTSISGQDKKNPTKADIVTAYYEGWSGNDSNPGKKMEMKLNLSVKINHINQVGQATGLHSDGMKKFAGAVGIELSDKVIAKLDKFNTEEITKDIQIKIYDLVYTEMSKATNIDKLIYGMDYFISFRDPSLTIIDIGSGLKVYFIENIKLLKKIHKNKSMKCIVRISESSNYSMDVMIGDSKILELSSRLTGGVYRNMVSTGPGLRDILVKPL